jgi:tRNA1Val (adenine37-N6)-methyltransferase
MPNPYFRFKQFTVFHDRSAMKVTTDGCLFGAWCADEIQNSKFKTGKLLDIGTGTGLLSLMMAQKTNAKIDAVEIDSEAAGQAGDNIDASPWKERIKVVNEDILSFRPEKTYDCIISNPPFYENELPSQKKEKNLAHHSSHLGLSQLLLTLKNLLNGDGVFFLLLPYKRMSETEKRLAQHGLFILKKTIVQQSTKHQPFRLMLMGATKPFHQPVISTISIRDENQQYTPDFTALLKDYYLYL